MNKPTKRERSRIKIMHAAKGLFDEYGVENVTFQMIAERADMCRTTVFNHFKSMNDLLVALTMQEMEDIVEYCESRGLKGRELLYGLIEKIVEDTACYPAFASTLIDSALINNEGESPLKTVENIMIRGLEDEGFTDIEHKLILLEGIYFGMSNHYHLNSKEFNVEDMIRESRILLDRILVKY